MPKRPISKRLSLIAGVLGLCLFGQGAYMGAKAATAQLLLERAWSKIEAQDRSTAAPWPWLDAQVVGRLTAPRLGASAVILDTDSGQALAFGPALINGTARPGGVGTIGVAAHKNTHFKFLKDLKAGDTLSLAHAGGAQDYIVRRTEIIDTRKAGLRADIAASELALVTCYPFDALSFNGPLRYIVYADLVNETNRLPDRDITRI